MAKTKTKKEEKVDLTPKAEKVSDAQLKRIQTIIDSINRSQMEIGQIETRKHQMLHYVASVNDQLGMLQSELKEQYGTDDINIQDGTIRYPENGETDKKD
tara:strand:+ start:125 stop:424 length:300 start_codon:yes stop_codon:yes gene_type:complete